MLTRLQCVRCIQVALSAILTVLDVDSSTLYGLSHLGEWQSFLLRLLIRTQSPGPTLVSASQVNYAYGQPNSTHSLCSFSFSPNLDYLRHGTLLLSLYPVYLQKPSTNCTHRHCTAVHLLYLIPYASIYIQYILLPPSTCFSVPTPLTPVTVNL